MNPFLRLLRPTQWLKNLMLFFPPFLGGAILTPGVVGKGVLPFASFCLGSSAAYVMNDLLDRKKDAHHPVKKHRPIACGQVSVGTAACLIAVCLGLSLYLAIAVSSIFTLLLLAYLIVSAAYSLKLKDLALFDLFCISSGFLLRLEAGGAAFGIIISEWLFLSVFLLAVFLSTGKRLSEKKALGESAHSHRKSLTSYPDGFLDGMMYMTGAAVLVTYTMYGISRHALIYSVPLCCFGLMRYILRVKSGQGGDPTESLLKDVPLLLVGVLWVIIVGYGIYK